MPPRHGLAGAFEGWMMTRFPSSEARTSKTGQQDVTLQIGGTCPARTWLAAVCHLLHKTPRRDKSDPRLLPLDQRTYSRLFTFATARALLPRATLHMLRHGGASTDGSQGLSDLALQERGGWEAQESVKRYRSAGRLLRRQRRLSAAMMAEARIAPGRILKPASEMLKVKLPRVAFPPGYS